MGHSDHVKELLPSDPLGGQLASASDLHLCVLIWLQCPRVSRGSIEMLCTHGKESSEQLVGRLCSAAVVDGFGLSEK